MVYIIGASSLDDTIRKIPYWKRRQLFGQSYTIPGLSFNPRTNKWFKVLQNLLSGRGILAKKHKIVIWHDVISNSISKHSSNNYTRYRVEELVKTIRNFKHRIEAIIYCRRKGNREIFRDLIRTGVPIIDVKKKLVSHRKSHDEKVLKDLAKIHPSVELEARLLATVWRKRRSLRTLIKRKPKTKNKPSKKERKRKQNHAQKL